MDRLFKIVADEGIDLEYADLSGAPRKLLGVYYPRPPLIVLDRSVERNVPLHRSVLAEELGHHFTVPRADVASAYTSYSAQVELSRDERRALRWACDMLLPVMEFADAAATLEADMPLGAVVEQLAEMFVVTPWLVWRRIHFLREDMRAKGLRVKPRDVFAPLLVAARWGAAAITATAGVVSMWSNLGGAA
ncbi:MAG: hypothetical protein IMW98_08620 [Firmicutes bacterium]|nr:hypothetical protein [Bacillota bacterium]MBE3590869.1 hypothetical protein [Bacillota bacterium]